MDSCELRCKLHELMDDLVWRFVFVVRRFGLRLNKWPVDRLEFCFLKLVVNSYVSAGCLKLARLSNSLKIIDRIQQSCVPYDDIILISKINRRPGTRFPLWLTFQKLELNCDRRPYVCAAVIRTCKVGEGDSGVTMDSSRFNHQDPHISNIPGVNSLKPRCH